MYLKRATVLLLVLVIALGSFAVIGHSQEAKTTNIKFWHAMGGWRVDFIKRMVEDFNLLHPNIEVEVSYKGSYRETLTATITANRAGNPPHVIQSFDIGTKENIDSGIFAPAEELVDKFGIEVPWDDYIDPALNYYKVEDKLYSFPWNSSNPILYANKDKLMEAGVELPKKPTFEDIVEVGQEIVDSGAAEAAITWPLHSWFFEEWMANMGQTLVNNGNGREGAPNEAHLTSDAAMRIFSWWKELYDKGLWVNPGLEDWAQARSNFISGRAAMLISSTSDVTYMENMAAEKGFELGTAYIPVPADVERQGVVIGGGNLWITNNQPEEELEAAVTFALWMSQPENAIRWHKGTGYFPIRKSAVDVLNVQGWFDQHPSFKTALDQLMETSTTTATAGALIGPFRQVRTIIEESFQSVMAGTSVEKALENAKRKTENAMEEYQEVAGS